MTEPSNEQRAEWAKTACDAFAKATGMDRANEELPTIIHDLLVDLRHLCDQSNDSNMLFAKLVVDSEVTYQEELLDEMGKSDGAGDQGTKADVPTYGPPPWHTAG